MVDLMHQRPTPRVITSVVDALHRLDSHRLLDKHRLVVWLLLALSTAAIMLVMIFYAVECGHPTSSVCGNG